MIMVGVPVHGLLACWRAGVLAGAATTFSTVLCIGIIAEQVEARSLTDRPATVKKVSSGR
jgi:hypothetical protein